MDRKVELVDLDGIMQQPGGRRVLRDILERTGYFDNTFSKDSLTCAFSQGNRDIGVWLYGEMKDANPNQLLNIIKAHNDDD